MNGYSEMREAVVWVQMNDACITELYYRADKAPDKEYRSLAVAADPEKAYTALLIADQVEPGMTYSYDIYADGRNQTAHLDLSFTTQSLWQYRTDPPEFTIAAGSCAYINEEAYDRPGRQYGGEYGIFDRMAEAEPDMVLWLGDNVYFREADWFSRSGMLRRYTHARGIPEIQKLLRTGHHYAIWDDHDYGPNDALRSWPHKDKALEAFKLFFANNGYGVNGLGGTTSAFSFGDADFFLLDNRWHRTDYNTKTVEQQVFGKAQIDWLIENLAFSRAPFKFIVTGGQILNDAPVWENYANYPEERTYLLDRIASEGIKGVIFLTGDRHHTELCSVEHKGVLMYDLTLSPLTSGTHDGGDEATTNRVEGTLYNERNFGLLHLSGPRKARRLDIDVRDAEGNSVWEHRLEQSAWD